MMRARALLLGRESASGVTASGSESLKTQCRFSEMELHQMLLVLLWLQTTLKV